MIARHNIRQQNAERRLSHAVWAKPSTFTRIGHALRGGDRWPIALGTGLVLAGLWLIGIAA